MELTTILPPFEFVHFQEVAIGDGEKITSIFTVTDYRIYLPDCVFIKFHIYASGLKHTEEAIDI